VYPSAEDYCSVCTCGCHDWAEVVDDFDADELGLDPEERYDYED
jgi:hypothetical protein